MTFHIRPILERDEPFLWEMLYYAARMDAEDDKTVDDAKAHPELVKYVQAWGRAGDLGFIAIEATSLEPLGAAWVRLFAEGQAAYSKVDDNTPELVIAMLPDYVGQGIGTALMTHLVEEAKMHYPAIALNVRAENPACKLYQRHGFVVVEEIVNRMGGLSYDMRLAFHN